VPPPPPPPPVEEDMEIFTIVEEMPVFPGCDGIVDKTELQKCSNTKMTTFVGQNAGYPLIAREAGFEGTVFIRFVVERDGFISNIEVLKDNTPGGGLKEAAVKAVQKMNSMPEKWRPGKQRGEAVRVRIVVPIKFRLEDDSNDPPLASESGEYSIETDYIPNKKDKKNIVGTWEAGVLNGAKIPSSVSIQIKMTKKGAFELLLNGKSAQKGSYKFMTSGNKIEIVYENIKEYWGLKELSKGELKIIDEKMGQIDLVKTKK
jgi:protein TonB